MTDAKNEAPRFYLSVGIMLLFGYAYVRNPSEQLLIGALISMASGTVNYWLGSSKGSADKSIELSRQSTEPQDVKVTNAASEPVPTTTESV